MKHIVDNMGLFGQDEKRKRCKEENQENPRQSVKCLPLADAQFPTDESDDPETGEEEANKQNRKKHFQSTLDVSFLMIFSDSFEVQLQI